MPLGKRLSTKPTLPLRPLLLLLPAQTLLLWLLVRLSRSALRAEPGRPNLAGICYDELAQDEVDAAAAAAAAAAPPRLLPLRLSLLLLPPPPGRVPSLSRLAMMESLHRVALSTIKGSV